MSVDNAALPTASVAYPTEDYLGRVGPHWHRYLLRGFRLIGCPLQLDPVLTALSDNHLTVIDIRVDGTTTRCFLDWEWKARRFHLAEDGGLYFATDLDVADHSDRVLPIAQCCSSYDDFLFLRELPRLRVRVDEQKYNLDIVAIFRAGTLAQGRRVPAVRMIRQRKDWRSLTAVAPFRTGDPVPDDVRGKLLRFMEHLEALTETKLALALPGEGTVMHLDWSWRQTEIMAMGVCCVALRRNTSWVGDPQGCWIEIERDLSDLEDKIDYYLDHDDERLEIAANGRAYYDAFVAPEAMARYLVNKVLEHQRARDVVGADQG